MLKSLHTWCWQVVLDQVLSLMILTNMFAEMDNYTEDVI